MSPWGGGGGGGVEFTISPYQKWWRLHWPSSFWEKDHVKAQTTTDQPE